VLTRLDAVFSRDPGGGGYVQDRLLARAEELVRWLVAEDGVLYLCGRAATTAAGVQAALETILRAEAGGTVAAARTLIERWLADGKLRRDLYD
jgi:sulfite reductase (NADPH) flavoprotein alpha-component